MIRTISIRYLRKSFSPSSQGERSQFAALPRCFRAKDDLVVLEDLRLRGFTMVDRRKGLDERHLRVILRL